MSIAPGITIDGPARRVSLDVRNPRFFRNPLPAYAALHAQCPAFFWEEPQQWFFAGYEQVNSLLRDRPSAGRSCMSPPGKNSACRNRNRI